MATVITSEDAQAIVDIILSSPQIQTGMDAEQLRVFIENFINELYSSIPSTISAVFNNAVDEGFLNYALVKEGIPQHLVDLLNAKEKQNLFFTISYLYRNKGSIQMLPFIDKVLPPLPHNVYEIYVDIVDNKPVYTPYQVLQQYVDVKPELLQSQVTAESIKFLLDEEDLVEWQEFTNFPIKTNMLLFEFADPDMILDSAKYYQDLIVSYVLTKFQHKQISITLAGESFILNFLDFIYILRYVNMAAVKANTFNFIGKDHNLALSDLVRHTEELPAILALINRYPSSLVDRESTRVFLNDLATFYNAKVKSSDFDNMEDLYLYLGNQYPRLMLTLSENLFHENPSKRETIQSELLENYLYHASLIGTNIDSLPWEYAALFYLLANELAKIIKIKIKKLVDRVFFFFIPVNIDIMYTSMEATKINRKDFRIHTAEWYQMMLRMDCPEKLTVKYRSRLHLTFNPTSFAIPTEDYETNILLDKYEAMYFGWQNFFAIMAEYRSPIRLDEDQHWNQVSFRDDRVLVRESVDIKIFRDNLLYVQEHITAPYEIQQLSNFDSDRVKNIKWEIIV